MTLLELVVQGVVAPASFMTHTFFSHIASKEYRPVQSSSHAHPISNCRVVLATRLTLTEKSVAVANDASERAASSETIGLIVELYCGGMQKRVPDADVKY